ncbi:MAG: RnfABCDGE type electron transport complex subunit B [bacterium]
MFLNAIFVLGGLGLLFGMGLAFAEKQFAVQEDPRKEAIMKILPGANCGACGFAGCSAYAEAIVTEDVNVNLCPLGRKAKLQDRISDIMKQGAPGKNDEEQIWNCHGPK